MTPMRSVYRAALFLAIASLIAACAPSRSDLARQNALPFFEFKEATSWLDCNVLPRGRDPITAAIGPDGGTVRLAPLRDARREHMLLVHPGLQTTHVFTIQEQSGSRMGVVINAEPRIDANSGFRAVLILDATECPQQDGPFLIVEEGADGGLIPILSAYDIERKMAWAFLSDLSSYALANP